MAASHPPSADSQYVQSSQKMWDKFVKYAGIATAHVIVILLLMAVTLL